MRVPHRVGSLALVSVLAACGDQGTTDRRPAAPGAAAPTPSVTPAVPMDRLERPVAERLAPRLERDGLALDYVDCPPWTGAVPLTMVCDGYVEGVVGEVEVRLSEGEDGRVEFDASLTEGVVATSRLVRRLEREGWRRVDCGPHRAYPAQLGLRIVCRVHADGTADYVVATVRNRRGEVRIEDY